MSNGGGRLDAMVGRPSKDGKKTFWFRVGAAFPTQTGGWTVVLDAMPAPQDGQYRIVLTQPRQQNQQGDFGGQGRGSGGGWNRRPPQQQEPQQQQGGQMRDELDDEIPF